MRQAGRCWWKFLSGILGRMGFIAMEVNQSLYIFRNNGAIIAIWIHVNDGVVISNSPDAVSSFKDALYAELDIKWLDVVQQIACLKCAIGEGEVTISQRQLTNSILDAYPRSVLRCDSPLPVLPGGGLMPNAKFLDPTPFWSVIGSLAYLTCDNGIWLHLGNLSLSLWSNAGWGGDLERLQTGFIIKLGNTPIIWGSKWQAVVALSTCAAEYLAGDFNKSIFCDNQAAVQVLIKNKSRKQMHYLDQAFSFVNDTIWKHRIKVIWVKTADMQADALTKQLLGPVLLQALPFLGING
ncbi:hypothetical protein O181_094728 [Austropuccinia psidii MF-1]|uniref:Reverse transcriptase Ty1/copia-type domain-containing protein n=1 Tax=Austropuccinia psidii MF-1 TaxID=1389203 RepID=A0A9Q3J3P9_9BASI|nr:hypothetical protein [Austropuccinia psidii MF-1]